MSKTQATVGVAALALAASACFGWYESAQHDRKVQAAFREAVLDNPTPRMVSVEVDGVKRQGVLNKGAALDSTHPTTALIVAGNPQSACWYSTLRVVEGQTKLPFLQKIGGGEESETMFLNQALSGYTCVPVADATNIPGLQTPKSP